MVFSTPGVNAIVSEVAPVARDVPLTVMFHDPVGVNVMPDTLFATVTPL